MTSRCRLLFCGLITIATSSVWFASAQQETERKTLSGSVTMTWPVGSNGDEHLELRLFMKEDFFRDIRECKLLEQEVGRHFLKIEKQESGDYVFCDDGRQITLQEIDVIEIEVVGRDLREQRYFEEISNLPLATQDQLSIYFDSEQFERWREFKADRQ